MREPTIETRPYTAVSRAAMPPMGPQASGTKTAAEVMEANEGHPLLRAAAVAEVQTVCANLVYGYEGDFDGQSEVSPEFLRLCQQVAEFDVQVTDPDA